MRATVSRLGMVGGPAGWMRCLWGGCRRRLSSHSVLDAAVVSISPVVFGEVLVDMSRAAAAVLVRAKSIDKTKSEGGSGAPGRAERVL